MRPFGAQAQRNPVPWRPAAARRLAQLLLVVGGVLLASCQLPFFAPTSPVSSEAGVPLAGFKAKDGDYFPGFIRAFFPGAGAYTKSYPSLAEARSQVTLIEVKALNQKAAPANEANLSWSADGVYLGYEIVSDGLRKIMVKDLVGDYSRELQVIPEGANDFLGGMVAKAVQSYNAGLRWSRDSTRFAFMSNGGLGDYSIYVGAVGTKEVAISSGPSKDGYATWSPARNELAFVSSRTGNGDIYLFELGHQRLERLSSSEQVDLFPEWFPGGDALVYVSGDALNHDLFVVRRNRAGDGWSPPVALTTTSTDNLRPTVSPDGRYIAFYAAAEHGPAAGAARAWDIVVVPTAVGSGRSYDDADIASMVVARDVVIDLNTGPAWSPDSRKIFYVKNAPTVANPIYAYDLFSGRSYLFQTGTRMNRDILLSKLGILSFRAQVGVWDRVFVALTNQGLQLQTVSYLPSKIHYLKRRESPRAREG